MYPQELSMCHGNMYLEYNCHTHIDIRKYTIKWQAHAGNTKTNLQYEFLAMNATHSTCYKMVGIAAYTDKIPGMVGI